MTLDDFVKAAEPRNRGLQGAMRRGAAAFWAGAPKAPAYSNRGWGPALNHAWRIGWEAAAAGRVERPREGSHASAS